MKVLAAAALTLTLTLVACGGSEQVPTNQADGATGQSGEVADGTLTPALTKEPTTGAAAQQAEDGFEEGYVAACLEIFLAVDELKGITTNEGETTNTCREDLVQFDSLEARGEYGDTFEGGFRYSCDIAAVALTVPFEGDVTIYDITVGQAENILGEVC